MRISFFRRAFLTFCFVITATVAPRLWAAPNILSTTTYINLTDSSSHAVTMPATVNEGDLLLIFFTTNDVGQSAHTCGPPSGWTEIYDVEILVSSEYQACLFAKDADGTEGGGTATATTSAVVRTVVAHTIRVQGGTWYGTVSGGLEATTARGNSTTPDPPSETASWGSADNTWIVASHATNDDEAVSTWPTNFVSDQVDTQSGEPASNQMASMATASDEQIAATVDPATFTLDDAAVWIATTLVIRPKAIPIFLNHMRRHHSANDPYWNTMPLRDAA